MEGLAAVSLAGNILQFIHTTRQLVSTSREIFDSGTKREYLELEVITKELRTRADRLSIPAFAKFEDSTKSDETIQALASSCKDIADKLISVLDRLKLKAENNKWESFLQALRTQWHDRDIEALRERLTRIGSAVNARLADKSNDGILAGLNELLQENRRLEISRTQEIVLLRKSFEEAVGKNRLKMDEADLADTISKLASNGVEYSAEQLILSRIRFVRLEDRYISISPAHRVTLSWLFTTTSTHENHVESTTFSQWLQSDDDLYWISGRPGSGKSTLMKFLCNHELTKEHLRCWANSNDVIVADYFFWNAGKNDLQKSQEGLLRSLLYQILRQCPEYIRLVFAGAWRMYNNAYSKSLATIDMALDADIPTDVQGLIEALRHTCDLLTKSEKRLCFFIDGLDEYKGDTAKVIQLVEILRTLNHVKLCVSSRQWNEFEEAFGKRGATKLYMHEFNDQDINAYIDDVFANDENFQEMEDKETRGKALVQEIVTSANGVFLWVFLVVRSFQEGLREGDSISRLQSRLRELPTKLEDYFQRILFHDVKKSYRDQAAQMFLVALVALENLPLMAYWFLDEPDLPKEHQPLKVQQTNKRHRDAKKRLIASCKGLLEPHFRPSTAQQDSLPDAILFEYKVDFLHRTVRDYLEQPTTDIRNWAPPGFDPDEAICKAVFSQIMTAPQGREYAPNISALYRVFRYHAKITRRSGEDGAMMHHLEAELATLVSGYGISPVIDPPINDTGMHNVVGVPLPDRTKKPIVTGSNQKDANSGAATKHKQPQSMIKRWASKLSRGKSDVARDARKG